MRSILLALLAVLSSGAGAATTATQTPLVVRTGVDAQAAQEIKTSKPDVRKTFELTNATNAELTVTLVARETSTSFSRECTPRLNCTLQWTVGTQTLAPDKPLAVKIPADSSIPLAYSGATAERGSYQSEVSLRLADGTQPAPVRVRIVRAPLNLGDGAITIGPVGRLTWGFWSFASVGTVPVTIRNGGAESITVPAKFNANLRADDGSGNYPDDAGNAAVTCPPTTGQRDLADLPAQGVLRCVMQVDRWQTAGRYRAKILLQQPEFELKEGSADFTVRYPGVFCVVLLIIGGLLGAWVAGYQNSGRRRALETADLLEMREMFLAMRSELPADKAPDAREDVEVVLAGLERMRGELYENRDAEVAAILDVVAKRAPVLHRFGLLELRYRALDDAARSKIGPDYGAARDAAAAESVPDNAGALLETLDARISDAVNAGLADDSTPPAAKPEFFFQVWRTRSAKRLRALVAKLDKWILIAGIVLASLIGMLTLWQPSAAWGSLSDILLALFTGATAALTGAIGLQQLLKGYTLGQIGPSK